MRIEGADGQRGIDHFATMIDQIAQDVLQVATYADGHHVTRGPPHDPAIVRHAIADPEPSPGSAIAAGHCMRSSTFPRPRP